MPARRLVLAGAIFCTCGGPLGPIAGGRLAGTTVATPIEDWSFAELYALVQIETRPSDPHSVNLRFAVVRGRL